ncbi:MAG: peptidase [Cytophagaceae bacterium]|jgi:putative proteasome-type protease|nr:peptidase [Cytophagaceae bacterium]
MTYCLGVKLETGLLAIADTRITSGTDTTTAKKMFVHQSENGLLFLMTSGLRSVRDKALTYFKETLDEDQHTLNKMYKAVNALGDQLRRVAQEDRQALADSGLFFNLYTLVGGQLRDDDEPKMFLLYPEGNWIELTETSPFMIIGNSGYGKPILNRTVNYKTSIQNALKAGFLSFDSTRVSANDVDFPLDVLVYYKDSKQVVEHRFEKKDMSDISTYWDAQLKNALANIPEGWMFPIVEKVSI